MQASLVIVGSVLGVIASLADCIAQLGHLAGQRGRVLLEVANVLANLAQNSVQPAGMFFSVVHLHALALHLGHKVIDQVSILLRPLDRTLDLGLAWSVLWVEPARVIHFPDNFFELAQQTSQGSGQLGIFIRVPFVSILLASFVGLLKAFGLSTDNVIFCLRLSA